MRKRDPARLPGEAIEEPAAQQLALLSRIRPSSRSHIVRRSLYLHHAARSAGADSQTCAQRERQRAIKSNASCRPDQSVRSQPAVEVAHVWRQTTNNSRGTDVDLGRTRRNTSRLIATQEPAGCCTADDHEAHDRKQSGNESDISTDTKQSAATPAQPVPEPTCDVKAIASSQHRRQRGRHHLHFHHECPKPESRRCEDWWPPSSCRKAPGKARLSTAE